MSEALDLLKQQPDHLDPNILQAKASDPLKSVWVGASAGTGKTKVLTDRVLRLMLPRVGLDAKSATPPHKILCLTFTKTAAAEMSDRIYKRLSKWAIKPDAELKEELSKLIGEKVSEETKKEARKLFAKVLDTPGGLKIMTIHSFCQSVLKRFPIEAKVAPHFELMDEQGARDYLTKCLHHIIADAHNDSDTLLSRSFNLLTLHLDSEGMSSLMQNVMSKRSLMAGILKHHGGVENVITSTYQALDLDEKATEEKTLNSFTKNPQIQNIIEALNLGTKTDKEKSAKITTWLHDNNFDDYKTVFLTKKDEIAKRLATAGVITAFPEILDVMQQEAERVLLTAEKIKSIKLAELNAALITIAASMVERYEQYKTYRDRLDYDDLITKTCDLLSDKKMVPWVLFKLDNGIDHILVDEAQDTSRHQWQIVKALSDEFFEAHGSKENILRTLFVVGDEKQSIFSFQGADPEEFSKMENFFGNKAEQIQEGWEVLLNHSFRSTSAVLETVDKVFANKDVRKGIVADTSREVKHLAFRQGHAGLVEMWPIIKAEERTTYQPWQLPVEIDRGESPSSKLATKIASTIKHWLDSKEKLLSRNRPITAGDVLILVQSRGAFVELLMRALKSANVPVAGIDRITLLDEIAIIDILALAKFALLPKDDLTLASLLKSPLIGLNEDELYNMCNGRGKRALWLEVRDKNPRLADYLQRWLNISGKATPYEFFAEILNTSCFANDISGKRAFYSRLGFDIEDAIDEFLNTCLNYEQSHTPSLQSFVSWFEQSSAEIKREQENGNTDMVRIMTVHAAKGLQAPIVFLPDTIKKLHGHNKAKVKLLWPKDKTGVPLWSSRKEFDTEIYSKLQSTAAEKQEDEYKRLLYVAMTRAEDRLYICGHKGTREEKDDCWYSLIANNLPTNTKSVVFDLEGTQILNEENEVLPALRFEHQQAKPPKKETIKTTTKVKTIKLEDWVFKNPNDEPLPPKPLVPSRQEEEPAIKSPLTEVDNWKYSRGNIVHKLLEILPDLPNNKRETALNNYLKRPTLNIPTSQQADLTKELLAVLNHPEFAEIFSQNSRSEVPIVGLLGANVVSGQIDRLVVTKNEVLIVDYKSNRNPPNNVNEIPSVYIKQMQIYSDVVKNIYPNHKVKSALLWTESLTLTLLN